MAIVEVSVTPVGTSSASLGDIVAEMVKIARKHGVKHELNAMGTNMEGDLETLLKVCREMHEACFANRTPRVITEIRIDDRRDKNLTMEYKVKSVLEKVG